MCRNLFIMANSTCAIIPLEDNGLAIISTEFLGCYIPKKLLIHCLLGWPICCQLKDSSTSQEKLSDVKESHSLQMAEYDVSMGVDHEPSFNWWVLHILKKHDAIIVVVKKRSARFLKRIHKFGIE